MGDPSQFAVMVEQLPLSTFWGGDSPHAHDAALKRPVVADAIEGGDLNAQFLTYFSNESINIGLPWLNFATGQLPTTS